MSQLLQDLFVQRVTGGLRGGFYLEIGGNHWEHLSNTLSLERDFGWDGVSVELDSVHSDPWIYNRRNPLVIGDALEVDYVELVGGLAVDYLSCDCEPAANTFAALRRVLAAGVFPDIITFEHEFVGEGPEVMVASRDYLRDFGYQLVAANVCGFEDWWVDPDVYPGLPCLRAQDGGGIAAAVVLDLLGCDSSGSLSPTTVKEPG